MSISSAGLVLLICKKNFGRIKGRSQGGAKKGKQSGAEAKIRDYDFSTPVLRIRIRTDPH